MIEIGVIGCGHWGPNHIRNFNLLENVKVTACADLLHKRLEKMGELYPQIYTTVNYMNILLNREIDAVVVATPTSTHYDVVKRALLEGKDVLCEKPLTVDVGEAKELVELADDVGRILMVGHVFLFNAGVRTLCDLIRREQLGEIYYVHCVRTNLGPIRNDVNCVYDLASHDIYIANYLLDSQPYKVIAKGENFIQSGVEDVAFISLSYPKKVLVNIHVSWLDPVKVRRITVVGSQKMVIWDDMDAVEPIKIFDRKVVREPYYDDYGEFRLLAREGDIHSPKVVSTEPLKEEAMHFIDCIRKRNRPICDGWSGLRTVEILAGVQAFFKNNKQKIDQNYFEDKFKDKRGRKYAYKK